MDSYTKTIGQVKKEDVSVSCNPGGTRALVMGSQLVNSST